MSVQKLPMVLIEARFSARPTATKTANPAAPLRN